MRRVAPTVLLTSLGLFGLSRYHSEAPPKLALEDAAIQPTATAPATTTPAATAPTATAHAATTPATTALRPVAPPGAEALPNTASVTVDGPSISMRWGTVQVRVTVSGGMLTNLSYLQMPGPHRRSQDISSWSGPELRSEALVAQSADVDTVSGATATSGAYRQSLQGALDGARVVR